MFFDAAWAYSKLVETNNFVLVADVHTFDLCKKIEDSELSTNVKQGMVPKGGDEAGLITGIEPAYLMTKK